MAVNPQASLPVTITDADPNIPGSGTAANAASIMPNLTALRDAHNTHTHTDLAQATDLSAHTQLTTSAHGGIVASNDARVNSILNTSRITTSFILIDYLGFTTSLANTTTNTIRAARMVAPFSGTLYDLSVFVGTASGNISAAIYDSGTTRSLLYNCGSTAMAGTNAWQTLAFNSTLSTTVTGNQTVGASGTLTVGSTTGFARVGSIVVGGTTYAYSAVPSGTTLTLVSGGTFTGGATVTQAGFTVTAGTHYDFAVMLDNGTGTVLQGTLANGALGALPTNNYLPSTSGAQPKLAWSNAPGSFTWPSTVAEASAIGSAIVPLIVARVA